MYQHFAKSGGHRYCRDMLLVCHVIKLQSGTKYLEQNREIQSYWTGKEKFDIHFSVIFDCYCSSHIS